MDNPSQQMQMQQLQGAVKGLTKLLQNNQQPTAPSNPTVCTQAPTRKCNYFTTGY